MSIAELDRLMHKWNSVQVCPPEPQEPIPSLEQLNAAGVARLEEMISTYGFRPHLNIGGGSGFTWPDGMVILAPHSLDSLVSEFSRLWFAAPGFAYIDKHGASMPRREFSRPRCYNSKD